MKYTTQISMSVALIAILGLSACGGGSSSSSSTTIPVVVDENTTTPEIIDENTTKPNDDITITPTSSEGIVVATSNETTKSIYEIYGAPLLKDGTLYTRLFRPFSMDADKAMKVVAYDLTQLKSDMNLNDLPTNILYEQVGPNYTNANFNTRYYDIAEVNNQLYFATMPESKDTLSQSSIIKYDIASASEIYHRKETPLKGENLNITFDLARGWLIPFDSATYIGIVEDAIVKVINASDGSSYKYNDKYDYFGRGATGGAYTDGIPPVATDSRFFSAFSSHFYSVSFISNDVTYGDRNTGTDPEYIEKDVLADFKGQYIGSKDYKGILQQATLILDDTDVYALTAISYEDGDNNTYYDLYLLIYGTDATLKSATYLDGSTMLGNWFDVFEPYKYKDTLYFKFRHDQKDELCAYNVVENKFIFRHEIGNHPRVEDLPKASYVVTGERVIMPEFVKRADYDADNNLSSTYYYDLVFQDINSTNGAIIKTIHHKDLDGLRESVNDVNVHASVSDAHSVYFFATRTTDDTKNNLIIKIDTQSNKIQKSRNRFDNHLTGVLMDSN